MQEDKYIAWAMQTSKKWSDIASVFKYTGIEFIDHDHRTLVEYSLRLNKVLDKSEKEFSLSLIKETEALLNEIYEYTEEHFTREEEFMIFYQIEGFTEHQYEHAKILKMLRDVVKNFKQGKINVIKSLKIQILDWLLKHINIVDIEFFKIEKWSENIYKAKTWDDVRDIIKQIGNRDIDEQHQVMTELALNTITNMELNPTAAVIDENCEKLTKYAEYHFQYEADFMDQYKIEEKERHLRVHDVFINMIQEYKEKIKNDSNALKEMKNDLLSWWIEHINKTDSQYFSYSNWGYTLLENSENIDELGVILSMTNIEVIDEDHKKLMAMTLRLNGLITQNEMDNEKHNNEILNLLKEIHDFAKEHFEREEAIILDEGLDGKLQSAEHAKILEKIKEMHENLKMGRVVVSNNMKTMLLEWWIDHTNKTDYNTFILNNTKKKQQQKS